MLSDSQLKFLSDVSLMTGQVCLASLVIPYFISQLNAPFLSLGILLTASSWLVGLLIIRNIKNI